MTVGELIDRLKNQPPDREVWTSYDQGVIQVLRPQDFEVRYLAGREVVMLHAEFGGE